MEIVLQSTPYEARLAGIVSPCSLFIAQVSTSIVVRVGVDLWVRRGILPRGVAICICIIDPLTCLSARVRKAVLVHVVLLFTRLVVVFWRRLSPATVTAVVLGIPCGPEPRLLIAVDFNHITMVPSPGPVGVPMAVSSSFQIQFVLLFFCWPLIPIIMSTPEGSCHRRRTLFGKPHTLCFYHE